MPKKVTMEQIKEMGLPLEGAGFLSDLLPGPLGSLAGLFGLGVNDKKLTKEQKAMLSKMGGRSVGGRSVGGKAPSEYAKFVKAHIKECSGTPQQRMREVAKKWKASKK